MDEKLRKSITEERTAALAVIKRLQMENDSVRGENAKLKVALRLAMTSLKTYGDHPLIEKKAKLVLGDK